jgi:hypothetical protein
MAFQAKNSGSSGNAYVCTPSRSNSGKTVLACTPAGRPAAPSSRSVQSSSCTSSSSSSSSGDHCDYDVIIIGAGTSGSVAAKYISDNERLSVLVLEAGENQNENIASKYPFGP